MNYFVITESEGVVSPAAFTRLLKSRWPTATVEEVHNPASNHALEFSVPMEHSRVDGSLNREGCSIVFIGDIRDCADFALRCRTLLPPGEPATLNPEPTVIVPRFAGLLARTCSICEPDAHGVF